MTVALILAGGLGTRLGSLVKDTPKPMLPIRNIPFLDLLLRDLRLKGTTDAILLVGYKYNIVTEYFVAKNEYWPNISFSIESKPLGTGGAIKKALSKCSDESVIVLNGDTYFDIDHQTLLINHKFHDSDLTIATRFIEDGSRYGTIETDKNGKVVKFRNMQEGSARINGGTYVLQRDAFLSSTDNQPSKFSFEDFIKSKLQELQIYACDFNGSFLDIGIQTDYQKAQEVLFND